jgi:CRISPR-associated protein Csm2
MTEVRSSLLDACKELKDACKELKKNIEEKKEEERKKRGRKEEKDEKEEKEKFRKLNENIKKFSDDLKKFYKNLIKEVNQDIMEKGMLNIDLEVYIQPEGICECIACAVGYVGKLKRSQLRKFFNEIKTLEYDLKKYDLKKEKENIKKIQIGILALIPKLAYSKGRELIDEDFYDFMKTILMKVKEDMNKEDTQKVFEVFVKILESIVAYHIFHFPNKEA